MPAEARDFALLAHHDLAGAGNGGEGLVLQRRPDGRRIFYVAHESAPQAVSILDVTDPRQPALLCQLPVEHPRVRGNSLAVVGDLLLVARQVARAGDEPAGLWLYDVSDPAAPRQLAFFNTGGGVSRGVHFVWCVDGKYAHISTGAPDFVPTAPPDDQFYMIVDVSDPEQPREVGRWWLPGTRQGDAAPPIAPRRKPRDNGVRMHNANVLPARPDRVYLGYIDGGVLVLDIADPTAPRLVGRLQHPPELPGYAHTATPLPGRDLLVLSEESVLPAGADAPKLIRLVDVSDETRPRFRAVLPDPPNRDELCRRGGRFGAHNVHEIMPLPGCGVSESFVVGTFFAGGMRLYDVRDADQPREIGYYIPEPPPDSPAGAIQLNDVYVDDRGLFYTVDRFRGGLYILEYTGPVALDFQPGAA
ncbi:MAG TPA: hypothetical protein VK066_31150 [Chloroflexota bacterium]|nr:hypothetical protein [Chloroflexota bacterium]